MATRRGLKIITIGEASQPGNRDSPRQARSHLIVIFLLAVVSFRLYGQVGWPGRRDLASILRDLSGRDEDLPISRAGPLTGDNSPPYKQALSTNLETNNLLTIPSSTY